MLDQTKFNSVLPFAQMLQSKGLILEARNGGIVQKMMNSSTPIFDYRTNYDSTAPNDTDYYFSMIENWVSALRDENRNLRASPYGQDLSEIVKTLKPKIEAYVSYARNHVNPQINALYEDLSSYVRDYKIPSAMDSIDIFQVEVFDLMTIDEEMRVHKGEKLIDMNERPERLTLPEKPADELKNLALTGSGRVDMAITQFVSTFSDEELLYLWRNTFNSPGGDSIYRPIFIGTNDSRYKQYRYNTLVFLWARKLIKNPDIAGSEAKISLTNYNTYLNNLMRNVALYSMSAQLVLDSYKSSSTVIIDYDRRMNSITVHRENYQKYLSEGGKTEIVIAAAVSASGHRTIKSLTDNTATLTAKWSDYKITAEMAADNRTLMNFKAYCAQRFFDIMNNLDDDDKQYESKMPAYKKTALTMSEEYIGSLTRKDLESTYTVALTLIAMCKYHFNNSYVILKGINEIGEASKKSDSALTAKQAARMSVLKLVAMFVADQLYFIKKK